jgi:hypothetical protein
MPPTWRISRNILNACFRPRQLCAPSLQLRGPYRWTPTPRAPWPPASCLALVFALVSSLASFLVSANDPRMPKNVLVTILAPMHVTKCVKLVATMIRPHVRAPATNMKRNALRIVLLLPARQIVKILKILVRQHARPQIQHAAGDATLSVQTISAT